MLIQIHILQNYAPANLNRDDTGAPKDAFFGGIRRGRISSQCLKRSMRKSEIFKAAFEKSGMLGIRTKALPELIRKELINLKASDEEIKTIIDKIPEIIKGSTKANNKEESESETSENNAVEEEISTNQLIFISQNEVAPFAAKLLELYRKIGKGDWKKSKSNKEITRQMGSSLPKSVDIAMFGRMTTSTTFENVQAAVQVAHAITTNALASEFDYFTAVDDLSGQTGAGMIGDVEFNSSTYYKYLNIHWEGLTHNLADDYEVAKDGVASLLEAAALAHPSGKQNSFAAFNPPDFIMVEIYERNLPFSYANAFQKPIRVTHDLTLMEASIKQFEEYVDSISASYNLSPKRATLKVAEPKNKDTKPGLSLNELKEWLRKQLPAGK